MEITLHAGQTLWDALSQVNQAPKRNCNGKGICGACVVDVAGIGRVKSCQFTVPGTYEVHLPAQAKMQVVQDLHDEMHSVNTDAAFAQTVIHQADGSGSTQQAEEQQQTNAVYIAVDIGTTTVALTGVCGDRVLRDGFINPQRRFGADVISRIEAANARNGPLLQQLLKDELLAHLEMMCTKLDPNAKTCRVGIAANTTMLHLLRGFSCEGLGCAPFQPVDLDAGEEHWRSGNLEFAITYLPGISAYIGADIVSGIYALHMSESRELSLLLDLGTNGEMVIGNADRMLSASAAAGPAFEGNPLALQIHASGILKNLHLMRKRGMIDQYGTLAEPYFTEGYPISGSLCMTQDFIREIQMAKGAICAGLQILLQEYGVTAEDVAHIYLAGGMGYYLDPADAIGIGLLPAAFAGRTQAVGNTSLQGILRMFEEEAGGVGSVETLRQIAAQTQEIVLANHPDFEEAYIEGMNF